MNGDGSGGVTTGSGADGSDRRDGQAAAAGQARTRRAWIVWSLWRTTLLVAALAMVLTNDGWRRSVWLVVLAVLLATTWVFRPSRVRREYTPAAALREPGDYRVVLQVAGDRPLRVMGELRRITGADVATVRNLARTAPVVVVENLSQESAEQAAHLLQAAGARAVAAPMDRASGAPS